MESIDHFIRRSDLFIRRRDLLARGYGDGQIRRALAAGQIFRVRQGWYSVPDAPSAAVAAVRIGGRLTSVSALESYGLRVPRRPNFYVAVPRGACRLRKAHDRHRRLASTDPIRVFWIDDRGHGGSIWQVSPDDALLAILCEESRFIAVACCSAVMHHWRWSPARLAAVFHRAPAHVQGWQALVSALDEAHGETLARLGMIDAGVAFVQQVVVRGVGRFDFRVGKRTYVEIDGGQHDPEWTGEGESTWDKDHDRDMAIVVRGGAVHRYIYRQLYTEWPQVLAAIERAISDDAALTAYRRLHPYRPRVSRPGATSPVRKRRRSAPKTPKSAP